jgi:epoxyqueuosine reductase
MTSLAVQIKSKAIELGFSAAGITGPEFLSQSANNLRHWIEKDLHGTMGWMVNTAEIRSNPKAIIKETQSVLIVALNYFPDQEPFSLPSNFGNISIYARGRDYHKVLRKKLKHLFKWIQSVNPAVRGQIFVDSFPIMEKSLAVKCGLGWIGKNTMLILKGKGSYFFLGGLFLSIPLTVDEPFSDEFCGNCQRCLKACPTNALYSPKKIDARRCISYLTIEHRGKIDPYFHNKMANNIFGCDICQKVCPWNRMAQPTGEIDFSNRFSEKMLKLSRLNYLSKTEYEKLFEGTAVRRAGFKHFQQVVKIAQKNNDLKIYFD